jgi:hypothetical protein
VLIGACGRISFDPHRSDARGDIPGDSWREHFVKASNPDAGDQFGLAIALSSDGSTLAVGAPLEGSAATSINGDQLDNSEPEAGAVYVFRRSGDVWTQEAYVKASNAQAFDQFGWAVALSGDGTTLAVGARKEDSSATGIDGDQSDNSASGAGAVYVYTRAGSIWTQQAYVKASNSGAQDTFGQALALSSDGNTLAVGAPFEASAATGINGDEGDNSAAEAGAIYVFTRIGSAWTPRAYVKSSNTEGGDQFGFDLALSSNGSKLVAAAQREDSAASGVGGDQTSNATTQSGAVYLFDVTGGTVTQTSYVKASNPDAGDTFGYSLAMNDAGTRMVAISLGEASASSGIDANQADDTSPDAGAAYVFDISTGVTQQTYIKASNPDAGDELGYCADLSAMGNALVLGAVNEASNARGFNGDQTNNDMAETGAAYLFVDDGGWSQRAYIKASAGDPADQFGWACAISANGGVFAISAPFEDSGTAGVGAMVDEGADASGAVYLYY